jgi:hypothetical protein
LQSSVATAPAVITVLPRGHWQGDHAEALCLCLDVMDESILPITFHDGRLRHPVVIEATYALTRYKKAQAELALTVRRIVTKELGVCRRFWVRQDLPRYDGLSLSLRPGARLRLRLTFSCRDNSWLVELCFDPESGSAAKRATTCQQLSSSRHSHCQPDPPTRLEEILPP